MAATLVSSFKTFEGHQNIYSHQSKALNCQMNFGIYIPNHEDDAKLPVLYWLSGLTCTEKNFIEKSGFQQYAAKYGIIVVGPDTSPRGCNIEGEDDCYDFGSGAGFYVDATESKWEEHYKMYSYVTEELAELIDKQFPTNGKMSIFGHSMGGHGALICALKNPGKYQSVSAFAPICNPMLAPWGQKAFQGYLGEDKSAWEEYDSVCLIQKYAGPRLDILITQGTEDNFLAQLQLLPENLLAVGNRPDTSVKVEFKPGYDHSYFFISTFMGAHFEHHAKYLIA